MFSGYDSSDEYTPPPSSRYRWDTTEDCEAIRKAVMEVNREIAEGAPQVKPITGKTTIIRTTMDTGITKRGITRRGITKRGINSMSQLSKPVQHLAPTMGLKYGATESKEDSDDPPLQSPSSVSSVSSVSSATLPIPALELPITYHELYPVETGIHDAVEYMVELDKAGMLERVITNTGGGGISIPNTTCKNFSISSYVINKSAILILQHNHVVRTYRIEYDIETKVKSIYPYHQNLPNTLTTAHYLSQTYFAKYCEEKRKEYAQFLKANAISSANIGGAGGAMEETVPPCTKTTKDMIHKLPNAMSSIPPEFSEHIDDEFRKELEKRTSPLPNRTPFDSVADMGIFE